VFHEQSKFSSEYFKSISSFVTKRGLDPKQFLDGVLYSTGIVIANDGTRTNKEVFWDNFFKYIGRYDEKIMEISDEYYVTEFKKLKQYAECNDFAKQAVDLAHKDGKKVILATNPVFPMTAQLERMSWVGLTAEDFDLITSYENSCYCKPNPKYYLEICKKIGVPTANVVMIGNDEREDMKAASEAGMMCYLATDYRIMAKDYFWTGQRGTFEQSLRMLKII
jgi:HAD superfamily hydrolase (TIGR01549 family)